MSRSKRKRVAGRAAPMFNHLKVAIILFLSSGCIPNHTLVTTYRRYQKPRAQMLPNEIALSSPYTGQMDRTPFDKANCLGYRVLGNIGSAYGVVQQMAFFYTAFLLLSQFTEYFPSAVTMLYTALFSALRYEHYVILALPPYRLGLSIVHREFPFACLAAHVWSPMDCRICQTLLPPQSGAREPPL